MSNIICYFFLFFKFLFYHMVFYIIWYFIIYIITFMYWIISFNRLTNQTIASLHSTVRVKWLCVLKVAHDSPRILSEEVSKGKLKKDWTKWTVVGAPMSMNATKSNTNVTLMQIVSTHKESLCYFMRLVLDDATLSSRSA